MVPEILTGILRDSLRFDGLVVTDALNMGGGGAAYGVEAGVRAFLAGADLGSSPPIPAAAIDAMKPRSAGEITPERLDRSVRGCSRSSRVWAFPPPPPCRSTASP